MRIIYILASLIILLASFVPAANVAAVTTSWDVAGPAGTRVDARKLVCLFFDDGWENQIINAAPVLQQYGYKATFAIVTSWIGNGSGNSKAMTVAQIQQLANQGMDIAAHTKTHPNLKNVSAIQLQDEVAGSKAFLEQSGFNVRTFIYPYDAYNDTVIAAVRSAGFICARTEGKDKPFDPASTDPNARFTVDSVPMNGSVTLTKFATSLAPAGEHSVIGLCYHSISDSSAAPSPRVSIANFVAQMKYLHDNGFTVVRLPDLIQDPPPTIGLYPIILAFTAVLAGGNPAGQVLSILNPGSGTIDWTLSKTASWLTLSKTSGINSENTTVSVSIAGLAAGVYGDNITVAAPGATNSPRSVPIALTITPPTPTPTINVSPTSFTFSATQGSTNPASQALSISNSGTGTLAWKLTKSASWLALSKTSGTNAGSSVLSVNISNLAAGTYADNITVTATGASNSPVKVPVTLTIAPPAPPPPPYCINPGDWRYRKQCHVTGSTVGELRDYQVRLTVYKGAGTDNATAVFLNNHCRDDFVDIVFSRQDGVTGLDYWVESYTSGVSAVVWVELDYVPPAPASGSFYCYYDGVRTGPPAPGSDSQMLQRTFDFADDFDDSSLDTANRWTVASAGGSCSESAGTLTVTGGKEVIRSKGTYGNQYALHARVKLDQAAGTSYRIVGFNDTNPDYNKYYTSAFRYYPGDASFTGITGNGTSGSTLTLPVSVDANFHLTECRRYVSGGVNYDKFIIDGKPEVNGKFPTNKNRNITVAAESGSNSIILDWIFLRKFVSPEPVLASWEAEQPINGTVSPPTIAFSPADLGFTATEGGANPPPQTLVISNTGISMLLWSLSKSASWLSISPVAGTNGGSSSISVNGGGLAAGRYTDNITISAPNATNSPQTVPVTFTISVLPPPTPTITFNPSTIPLSASLGGANPTAALSISNSGTGVLNWQLTKTASWLILSSDNGTNTGTVTVTGNLAGLAAGTYSDGIAITAAGATNSPQIVPITLTVSSSPLPGWTYRKPVTIAGSAGGALTGYQVKLTVNRSDGADSGSTVFLGTKCSADYRDLRFTNAAGAPLDYWIESATTASAILWVELDFLPASPSAATFYCYYGNAAATAASNIKNTFVFADDFEDGTLDTASRWTVPSASGSYAEAGGTLTVTGGKETVRSRNMYSNQYALHARVRLDQVAGTSYRIIGFNETYPDYTKYYTSAFRYYPGDANFTAISGNVTSGATPSLGVPVDANFHVTECRRYSSGGAPVDSFIIDGRAGISGKYPTANSRYVHIISEAGSNSIIVDWVFLRKFLSPEPSVQSWGSEQTL